MKRNLVIGFYGHPEYYPPTLNALQLLSPEFSHIAIAHRNYPSFGWPYPSNVSLHPNAGEQPMEKLESASIFKKIWLFLRFTACFYKLIRRLAPDTILLYDSLAVLAYRIIRPFIRRPRLLWYHNHDAIDLSAIRKYSLSWAAWKAERKMFPRFDIFSLPSVERQAFFPMEKLGGEFIFLPNYPSLNVYKRSAKKQSESVIRILFQGSIGEKHGLEEIITLLPGKINGKDPELILKGFVRKEYLEKLYVLADDYGVRGRLVYLAPGGYQTVIENAQRCHIGIAIHKKEDIMNRTLGTASNKIYEYAASGLPVILYENEHFKEHLAGVKWAFFSDSSPESLKSIIEEIAGNYEVFSEAARDDFEEQYNFEKYFQNVIQKLNH